MRRTWPPVIRGILRCDPACWRCGSPRSPASTTITRRNVYHQALLRYIGCNADTHLLASAFGDEIALRRDLSRIDIGNKSELAETIVRAITRTFADAPPAELAKAVERGLAEAMQVSVPILSGHCEVAQRIAERIGLSGRDPRKSRPALRALGRKRIAARPVGQCREACRSGW